MPLRTLLPAETSGPAETLALGRRIGEALAPGDVLALYGDLGAGKTHLAKGIAGAFGIAPEDVTSPTFTLLAEHEGDRAPLYHFDAYRIARPEEFVALGFEEYAYGAGVCLVEWPERIEALLPARTLRLRIAHAGADRRRITALP